MKIVRAAKNNINRITQVFKLVRSSGGAGNGLPSGGTVGQILKKSSLVDYAAEWFTLTKAFIGLGNVTDDAQLKRSAGDFQAFTQKITPAVADSILIEDQSDGWNKKWITIDSIKTLFTTAFNLLYSKISSHNPASITTDATINASLYSHNDGAVTADMDLTLAGFTDANTAAKFTVIISGAGAPTISLIGYTFDFPTDQTLTLTSMPDGTYQVFFTWNSASGIVTVTIRAVA